MSGVNFCGCQLSSGWKIITRVAAISKICNGTKGYFDTAPVGWRSVFGRPKAHVRAGPATRVTGVGCLFLIPRAALRDTELAMTARREIPRLVRSPKPLNAFLERRVANLFPEGQSLASCPALTKNGVKTGHLADRAGIALLCQRASSLTPITCEMGIFQQQSAAHTAAGRARLLATQ
jgi:hypothetical protein